MLSITQFHNRPSRSSFTKKTPREEVSSAITSMPGYSLYRYRILMQQITKRGYVLNMSYKRKRGKRIKEDIHQKQYNCVRNKRGIVGKRVHS